MTRLRVQKLERQIERDVSSILMTEVKDSRVGFITITSVQLTNDLSIATIYYTVLGKDERTKAAGEALERAKGFIRTELGKRLQIRKVPEIHFKYDNSSEYGNKIDEILRNLKND